MSLFSKAHFVLLLPLIGVPPSHSPVVAQDCNQNGIPDYVDVAPWVEFLDERELDLGFSPAALISADFNGDGAFDLAAKKVGECRKGACTPNQISILHNLGDATFREEETHDGGGGSSLLTTLDLNGDGAVDVIAFEQDQAGEGSVLALLNDGQGHFGAATYSIGIANYVPSQLIGADLTGDGLPDLAMTVVFAWESECMLPGVVVLLNRGDGTFEPPSTYLTCEMAFDCSGIGIDAADLNGDGHVDLIGNSMWGCDSGHLLILWNQGGGMFLPGDDFASAVSCDCWPRAFDADGDDDADIVLLGRGLTIFENNGKGAFNAGSRQEGIFFGASFASFVADLDLDGLLDLGLIRGWPERRWKVLLNHGLGVFEEAFAHPLSSGEVLKSADLSGDGRLDLVVIASNAVFLLEREADGTFTWSAEPLAYFAAGAPELLMAADFDRNGAMDVLTRGEFGPQRILLGERSPSPSLDSNHNAIPDECEGPPFHRGDPNADGSIDVSDPVGVLAFLFLGGFRPPCLESADANDDGTLDISDGIFLLGFLFLGGLPPPEPGPPPAPCGLGRDPPASADSLGCLVYDRC